MANEIINTGFVTDITTPENSAITVSADATDPGKYTIGLTSDEVNLDGNSQATGTPKRIKSKFILRSTTKDEGNNVTPSANEPIVIWDSNNKAQIAIGDGATTAANLSLIGHVPLANGETAGTVKAGGDITIADGIINVVNDSHTHDTQYYPKSEIDGKITTINNALNGKVNVDGDKKLSTNDFTNDLLGKLNGIDAGAKVYSAAENELVLTNERTFGLASIHEGETLKAGPTTADYANISGTFVKIPRIEVDDFGRVTKLSEDGGFIATQYLSYKFENCKYENGKLTLSLQGYRNNTKSDDTNVAFDINIDIQEGEKLQQSSSNAAPIVMFHNGKAVYNSDDIVLFYDSNLQKTGITAGFFDGTTYWEQISGKPNFANVATSGSYNDLTDRPQFAYDSDDKALIIYPK